VLQVIVFNLKCAGGHGFEEWFASSADYEAKAAARVLACPECGSTHIEKGLSAPRINGGAQAPAPAAGPCGLPACAGGVCQMAIDAGC
jgi:hypothetical protein